jgi:hypothetical protein
VRGRAGKRLLARVSPAAPPGAPLELIGYATGPDDPLPIDDRGVDRGVVARRARGDGTLSASAAASGAAARRGYCRLGPPR